MKVFYDTEFLEDGKTIELLSIGMVREDREEYYAVNYDADWDRVREHEWLMKNVWPTLPLNEKRTELDRTSPLIRPKWVIANEVRAFILDTPDPELWAYYAAYDHVALCQLWGRMIDLPRGIPMWTNDLKQEIERQDNPKMPRQNVGEHNALNDAYHNLRMASALGLLGEKS